MLSPYQQQKLQQLAEIKDPNLRIQRILADRAIAEAIVQMEKLEGYTPRKGVDYFTDEEINSIIAFIEERIRVPEDGKDGKDGATGPAGAIGPRGETPLRGVDYWTKEDKQAILNELIAKIPKVKAIMPPTVDEIIAKLKQTPVDYRDIKDAPNLDDVQKLIGFLKQGGFRGGGDTVEAGSNIYISHVNGVKVISSTGGLGAPVEPTSGTIDNSNKVFTFLVKPTLVNVNGVSYREGKGWSWTAGTLTVTLDNTVGTGGDIFAL